MSKLAAYAFGLCLLLLSLDDVIAQDGDKPFNGLQEVRFVLNHRVDDGCWPRPQATKTAVEKLILQAGLNISET